MIGLFVALLVATGTPGVPPALAAQEAPVAITFLDVGQGDAIVIRAPDGRFAMIDAGRGSPLRQLTRLGVGELALLIATHAHVDHIGGLDDVLTARPVDTYLDNGTPHTTRTYLELMAHVERLDVRYLQAVPRSLLLGGVSLEILPLPSTTEQQNDRSVGVMLRYGDFSALLTGDSEREELDFWLDGGLIEEVTLLKAAHHGASNGFTYPFLDAAEPELVVISVGEGNSYDHPRPEALAAYTSYAHRVLRTDRDGTVTVFGYSDGRYDVVLGEDPYDELNRSDSGAGSDRYVDVGTSASDGENAAGLGALLALAVHADARGDDADNLNDEYVVIENLSRTRIGIGLWRLCDLSSRCFRFPPGSSIAPGRRVVVYTGYGSTDGVSFFMNNGRPVWNNNGDEATLLDTGGHVILRHVYEEE
ncbi:MAG: lamin tail domain-containing protein [Longimicrobiales bacterium]